MSKKLTYYRKIFLIRFAGYFLVQVGLLTILLILEPVLAEEFKFRLGELFGKHYILPNIVTSQTQNGGDNPAFVVPATDNNNPAPSSGFGDLSLGGAETIVPVSTDFGIVIEKINANAKVIADVDPGDEGAYTKALSEGVAHAKGTKFPGQKGNIYLFSHSVDAPWNVVRYNAIFYLLSKLDPGDRVIMFYQGRRFDYTVFDKSLAEPTDVKYLTNNYNDSVLTLQTCDPPGTLLRRLIVRAKLAGV